MAETLVVAVVAGDKLLEPGSPDSADHRGHVVELDGEFSCRGRDVHRLVLASAKPGVGVREQDYPQHRDPGAVRG